MKLAQTNLSRLKACQKLAGGKSEGRRPRSASHFVTTLKGWQSRWQKESRTPSGCNAMLTVFQQPFGLGPLNVAPASWSAPALWRFCRRTQFLSTVSKAAEGCRSPRPCGVSDAPGNFSAGGAQDSSPRREPWVMTLNSTSSGRSERNIRYENLFLPPLRGLRALNIEPTAVAVGYYLSPLRGCGIAARNETAARN